jgi:hypothetical protein
MLFEFRVHRFVSIFIGKSCFKMKITKYLNPNAIQPNKQMLQISDKNGETYIRWHFARKMNWTVFEQKLEHVLKMKRLKTLNFSAFY